MANSQNTRTSSKSQIDIKSHTTKHEISSAYVCVIVSSNGIPGTSKIADNKVMNLLTGSRFVTISFDIQQLVFILLNI